MPIQIAELLHFAPTNPLRTAVADYGRSYLAAIQADEALNATTVLDERTPESLDDIPEAIGWTRALTRQSLQARRAIHGHILHGEICPESQREFWALHVAARQRPDAPLCLMFHSPPQLPRPGRRPQLSPKSGRLERQLTQFTSWLATRGEQRLRRALLERASVLLGPSRRAADLLAQRYPEYQHKIGFVPPVMIGSPPPAELEPRHRKVSESITITCFGHVKDGKGIEDLVRALAVLHNTNSLVGKVEVHICGRIAPEDFKGGVANRIKGLISALRLRWLVDFDPGALAESQVNRLLAGTDILVLPYQTGYCDGTSRTLLRAGAWSVGVIASNAGSLPERVRHEEDGLLYPAGNIEALAEALQRMIKESEERIAFARAMRQRILEEHSPETVSFFMRGVYREILAARDEGRLVQLPDAARLDTEETPDFEQTQATAMAGSR